MLHVHHSCKNNFTITRSYHSSCVSLVGARRSAVRNPHIEDPKWGPSRYVSFHVCARIMGANMPYWGNGRIIARVYRWLELAASNRGTRILKFKNRLFGLASRLMAACISPS